MWQSASVSIKTALRTVQAAVHRYSIMKPLMQEKSLASSVLGALNTSLCVANPRIIKPNKEYFILKKSTSPTVIVECGFLSNPAETLLLTDKNYQDDLAHAIYIGVTDYLAQSPSGHLQ